MNLKLNTLLHYLHPYLPIEGANPEITSIENDDRLVKPGSLFICIKGYTVDGHDFAKSAEKNGAAAIIAERNLNVNIPVVIVKDTNRTMALLADFFYGHPSHNIYLIGVTGTNGKTTISHLIEHIFSEQAINVGLIGTIHTKISGNVVLSKNTTPESLALQKTFKQMLDEGVQTAVMEVSSHALVEGRVHGCDYDIAIFSNLTQDHLDFHKTMDEYKHAKGLLFSQMGNTFNKPKYAILNIDDFASKEYIASTAARVITYGVTNRADFQAVNIKMDVTGTSFDLISPFGVYSIQMKLVGLFSVYNTLASIAATAISGIPMKRIIEILEKVKGISGRFESVDIGQNFSVIVDYAHTPDSLKNVLKTIKQFAKKRIFVIVGCGGDRDKTKRPLMAKIACQFATDAVFTSDNPRSEDPQCIIKEMEAGVIGENFISIIDRRKAIEYVINKAQSDDVVLIAGKGHETYQQIGRKKYPFDDRLIAKKAIEERMKCQ